MQEARTMPDLDVHDLGRRDVDEKEVIEELTEEQKRELQRAMNPFEFLLFSLVSCLLECR
jgi:uncharacterized OsmC-like protein